LVRAPREGSRGVWHLVRALHLVRVFGGPREAPRERAREVSGTSHGHLARPEVGGRCKTLDIVKFFLFFCHAVESSLPVRVGAPGVLRFSADRRTLGTLAAHGVLTVAVWTASLEGVARLLAVGMLGYTAWLSAVVAHNTVHCPVFRRRWQNSAFQLWVSLSYGFPISEYIPGHNLSHHRHLQAREDVMR